MNFLERNKNYLQKKRKKIVSTKLDSIILRILWFVWISLWFYGDNDQSEDEAEAVILYEENKDEFPLSSDENDVHVCTDPYDGKYDLIAPFDKNYKDFSDEYSRYYHDESSKGSSPKL